MLSLLLLAVALIVLPICFMELRGAMRDACLKRPPEAHFFFVFGGMGGLLVCLALLGTAIGAIAGVVPIIIAPLAILVSSIALYPRRRESSFHRAAFWSGLVYIAIIVVLVTIAANL